MVSARKEGRIHGNKEERKTTKRWAKKVVQKFGKNRYGLFWPQELLFLQFRSVFTLRTAPFVSALLEVSQTEHATPERARNRDPEAEIRGDKQRLTGKDRKRER